MKKLEQASETISVRFKPLGPRMRSKRDQPEMLDEEVQTNTENREAKDTPLVRLVDSKGHKVSLNEHDFAEKIPFLELSEIEKN